MTRRRPRPAAVVVLLTACILVLASLLLARHSWSVSLGLLAGGLVLGIVADRLDAGGE
ncbi:MAG TPA: hypothetical protein VHX38_02040 [Pseudonocardiaceae bacterium]|nr:hypothetical protein [Pseudonocardiaceae bacterium]